MAAIVNPGKHLSRAFRPVLLVAVLSSFLIGVAVASTIRSQPDELETVASEVSGYVLSDDGFANLRTCPFGGGPSDACPLLGKVSNRQQLNVWCWVVNESLHADVGNYPSSRWFFVTVLPDEGKDGYIHASLVHLASDVPQCAGDPLDERRRHPAVLPGLLSPPELANSHVGLADGGRTPRGDHSYAVTLLNFVSDSRVTVVCYRFETEVGRFEAQTDHDGTAVVRDGCAAPAQGGTHSVRAAGITSDHIEFSSSSQPRTVTLSRGRPASAGYYYDIALAGFPANTDIAGNCHDTVSPEGFRPFTIRTDANGAASTQDKCRSGDGPDHWVTAQGVESNHVRWVVAPKPAPSKPDVGNQSPPPADKPAPTKPVPPKPPAPPEPPAPAPPKPTATNLVVVIYGGGHVGVAFDVGWQSGRDPVTCHFFIDGREVFTAQCGTRSSKQFYGISPGRHEFHATVSDRFGVYSDPTPTIVREVT